MSSMKKLAPLVLLLSCAHVDQTPVIDVSHTKPAASTTALPAAPPSHPLAEWHWRNPKAETELKTDDGRPLYLAVESARMLMGGGCSVSGSEGKEGYILCDHEIGRIVGNKIDMGWGRDVPLDGFVPGGPTTDGERMWLYASSASDGANDSFYNSFTAVIIRDGHNKWERIETEAPFIEYRGGRLLATVPPVAMDEKCPDASCLNVIPKFRGWDVKDLPDFSSLAGKIAWIHPEELNRDYQIVVDPDGPVHVLMRALDPKTKKRGFGIATWTPKGGAKFEWLPPPLDTFGAGTAYSSHGDAKDGKASIEISIYPKNVPVEYVASWDGKHWTAKKDHYPYESSEGEGYDPEAPVVTKLSAGDEWVDTHGMLYRTVPPDEVLVQVDRWSGIHPFAPPAEDDCATPFAVLDRAEKQTFAQYQATPADGWGVIDDDEIRERAVIMETESLVVIGVPFQTTKAAKEFLDHQPWTSSRGEGETPHLTVCARPVAPKKFERSN